MKLFPGRSAFITHLMKCAEVVHFTIAQLERPLNSLPRVKFSHLVQMGRKAGWHCHVGHVTPRSRIFDIIWLRLFSVSRERRFMGRPISVSKNSLSKTPETLRNGE